MAENLDNAPVVGGFLHPGTRCAALKRARPARPRRRPRAGDPAHRACRSARGAGAGAGRISPRTAPT